MSDKLSQILQDYYRHQRTYTTSELINQIRQLLGIQSPNNPSDISRLIITEIKKRQRLQPSTSIDVTTVNPQYQVILNDDTVYNPFIADAQTLALVNRGIKGLRTNYEKARGIYEWMEQNIAYGDPEVVKQRGYSNSRETLEKGAGICAEMTFLYVTMARSAGLVAKVAEVSKDFRGEKVQHACAAVLIEGRWVLVDVAYHTFDIQHQKFRLMSDREVIRHYKDSKEFF